MKTSTRHPRFDGHPRITRCLTALAHKSISLANPCQGTLIELWVILEPLYAGRVSYCISGASSALDFPNHAGTSATQSADEMSTAFVRTSISVDAMPESLPISASSSHVLHQCCKFAELA